VFTLVTSDRPLAYNYKKKSKMKTLSQILCKFGVNSLVLSLDLKVRLIEL